MVDEYIPPYCLGDYAGIATATASCTRLPQVRAIQLTAGFVEPAYKELRTRPRVAYVGLTRYYDDFADYMIGPRNKGGWKTCCGTSSRRRNCAVAAGRDAEVPARDKFLQRQVDKAVSRRGSGRGERPVRSGEFAIHPEMDARGVTEELLRRLADNRYAFIVVNYANGDMVGHTGDYEAAKRAIGDRGCLRGPNT